ncbi:MAG: hypothetical protein N2C14_06835, partial [Planctomycetales bacterium]
RLDRIGVGAKGNEIPPHGRGRMEGRKPKLSYATNFREHSKTCFNLGRAFGWEKQFGFAARPLIGGGNRNEISLQSRGNILYHKNYYSR